MSRGTAALTHRGAREAASRRSVEATMVSLRLSLLGPGLGIYVLSR